VAEGTEESVIEDVYDGLMRSVSCYCYGNVMKPTSPLNKRPSPHIPVETDKFSSTDWISMVMAWMQIDVRKRKPRQTESGSL